MITVETERPGSLRPNGGHAHAEMAIPSLGLLGRPRARSPILSPNDRSSTTGRYAPERPTFQPSGYGFSRRARSGVATRFGRELPPRTTVARQGPQIGKSAYRARLSGPAQFLTKLLDTWRLDHGAAVALLGLEESQRTYAADVVNGDASLEGRDIKDRIAHLFRIRKTLSTLFPDVTVENEWLREPHGLLDERSPMTLMLEGSMENLLLVKEYVETAAGL